MVDREGRTRLPKTPSLSEIPAYLSLAQGLCDAEDGACRATALVGWAAPLANDLPDVAVGLYREALCAAPEHGAALAAVDSLPQAARVEIWRAALEAEPRAPGLEERVARLFPSGVVPKTGFRPLEWLDLFKVLQRLDVDLVTDPDAGTPGLVPAERKLGTYRHSKVWGRTDLIGFRGAHMFLVTPIRDARAIRDCLLHGELVCTTLEELFAGVEHRRSEDGISEDHDMLIVFLFDSREEYLRLGESLRQRGTDARHAYTAGFFSPGDRISRFYLPDEGYKYRDLKRVLAHELTHHWVFASCPGFTNEEAIAAIIEGRAELPGHWIVEGFASLMEELAYDDEAGTFAVMNPRADRLDTIANSEASELLDWADFFRLTHAKVRELNPLPSTPEVLVPISWMEGRVRIMTEVSTFYAQAAATCHFLFTAEEGALRPKLLEFLVAYYSGDADGADCEQTLGLEDVELGARILKHVRAWGSEAVRLRDR
jgi:hypothetical protein